MKFIHTADWQLGMSFKRVQEGAEQLRRARIDAVKQIIALAEKEKVDFVIAAGDLFDENMLSVSIVEDMAKAVSQSAVPVYLLPGNHDPLTMDSPYVRMPDLFRDSAVVLRSEEPMSVSGGTLYPCPAKARYSYTDPTRWIPPKQEADGIRIGIAHGSIDTPKPDDYPISSKATAEKGLDYLALGHWHGVKMINERTWYSGAPEATAFGQENAGKVLLVEICAPGTRPKVVEKDIAKYKWCDLVREVHSAEDVTELIKELDSMVGAQTLIRLNVTGSLPQPQVDLIDKYKSDRCFFITKEINVALNTGTWEYKHKLLKGMAELLAAETEKGGEEAKIARRALSKLNSLVREAGFRSEGRSDVH